MIERQYASGISAPVRNTIARPVAIAMPRSPSHSPARPMTTQHTAVTVGHGDSTASSGAKKKPAPMYQADPARSEISTKRNHRGMFCSVVMPRLLLAPVLARSSLRSSLVVVFGCHASTFLRRGKGRNYLRGSGNLPGVQRRRAPAVAVRPRSWHGGISEGEHDECSENGGSAVDRGAGPDGRRSGAGVGGP